MNKFCTQCGEMLPSGARFCPSCGSRVGDAAVENASTLPTGNEDTVAYEPLPRVKRERRFKKGFITDLISRSLILALALLMVILAFCPLVSTSYKDVIGTSMGKLGDVRIKMNAFQLLTISIDSLYSETEEDIRDSRLYEKYEECQEELSAELSYLQDIDDLTAKQKRLISRYSFLSMRIAARQDTSSFSLMLLIGALVGLLYLAFSISFFVIALLALLSLFNIKGHSFKKATNALYRMLTFVPLATLFTATALTIGMENAMRATASLILPLILSLVLFLYLFITRIIFERVRYKVSVYVKRGISIVLCLLVVILSLTPLMASKIDKSSGRDLSVPIYASTLGSFLFSSSDFEELDDIKDMDFEETQDALLGVTDEFAYMKSSMEDTALAMAPNVQMLSYILAALGVHQFAFLFTLLPILTLLIVALALCILQSHLAFFLLDKKSKKGITLSKRLMAAFLPIAFLITLAFLLITSITVRHYLEEGYRITIHAGAIFFWLFTIGLIAAPADNRRTSALSTPLPTSLPTAPAVSVPENTPADLAAPKAPISGISATLPVAPDPTATPTDTPLS